MLNDDGWQTRGSEYVAHISEDGTRCESVATHLHLRLPRGLPNLPSHFRRRTGHMQ